MPRIIVDQTYCKGCGLCVDACPFDCIELSMDVLSAKGYHPARLKEGAECRGCSTCALMCPDVAITVEK